jgi:hypothetical protein
MRAVALTGGQKHEKLHLQYPLTCPELKQGIYGTQGRYRYNNRLSEIQGWFRQQRQPQSDVA